ncbi:MAG TPA: four-carbon acid sugar kinase family protein, partial [Gammaproteobacteria bacterium]
MPYLGCIADDFTGATDLANNLVRGGLRTLQVIGADGLRLEPEQAAQLDAVVVALKSRSVPAAMAVDDALVALEYLKGLGCQQFYFKYCSTFDSTDAGNIGPVAEALLDALDTPLTLYCPAFPAAGRTVYQG